MRLYLAGPMTGYKDLNFPLFISEAARLRALGHDVVNPQEINGDPAAVWSDCMRADIAQLVTCEGVACLPGWTASKGASLEVLIATKLGMSVRLAKDVEPMPIPLPAGMRVIGCTLNGTRVTTTGELYSAHPFQS